jgi:AraC-like DNA-binding protein
MLGPGGASVTEAAKRTRGLRAIAYRRDPGGGWELVTGRPAPMRRGAVREYAGYVETVARPLRRRELPTATIPVIVNFGPAYRLLDSEAPDDPARAIEQTGGFAAGLDDRFAVTESTGIAHCLQCNLSPLAAYRLFAHPMRDLARRVVSLDDLFGGEAQRLTERLAEQPSWERRFALLDAFLADCLSEGPAPSPEIVWAWRQLTRSAGSVAIATLREELGWSAKRLIARFREEVGLPPKQAARLLRFQRAAAMATGDVVDWCAFARRHGYFDQAHLINEFQRFAGETPQGVIRRRLPADGGFAG